MEIWKDISGYEGLYQVSNTGKVKSLDRIVKSNTPHQDGFRRLKGKLLKHGLTTSGYRFVALCVNGKAKNFSIHRLAATAFIPNPDNLKTVNHINGDKEDNRTTNLEWLSYSGQEKHAHLTRIKKGSNHPHTKLNPQKVKQIRLLIKKGDLSLSEIAKQFSVSQERIHSIKKGKAWKYD